METKASKPAIIFFDHDVSKLKEPAVRLQSLGYSTTAIAEVYFHKIQQETLVFWPLSRQFIGYDSLGRSKATLVSCERLGLVPSSQRSSQRLGWLPYDQNCDVCGIGTDILGFSAGTAREIHQAVSYLQNYSVEAEKPRLVLGTPSALCVFRSITGKYNAARLSQQKVRNGTSVAFWRKPFGDGLSIRQLKEEWEKETNQETVPQGLSTLLGWIENKPVNYQSDYMEMDAMVQKAHEDMNPVFDGLQV